MACIPIGLLQVDKFGIKSGKYISQYLVQDGQQLENIGMFFIVLNLCESSLASSIEVKSAPKVVSKT